MQQIILIIHVLAAVSIISLVLLQHGRGADVGASFGSGASNTMFGSIGAVPFLMKVTVACAGIFFITSISLSYLATSNLKSSQTIDIPTIPVKKIDKQLENTDSAAAFAPITNMSQDKKQKK